MLLGETGEIRPGSPEVVGGFYRTEGREEDRSAWMGPGPGVLRLEFARSRARWLEIDLSPLHWPGAPEQVVEVALDGETIGSFVARPEGGAMLLEVPPELSSPGAHVLELRPSRATAPATVKPGLADTRRLSVALRAVRVLPMLPAPTPVIGTRGLELSCGAQAYWPRWVAPGTELSSLLEPRLTSDSEEEVPELLFAETAGGEIRAIGDGPWPPDIAGAVRLTLACASGTEGRVFVRSLVLREPSPALSPDGAQEEGTARPVVLIVGRLEEGFPVTPCSTRYDAAMECLTTGIEATAFGYAAPRRVGHLGTEVDDVVRWLESAEAPALAALIRPEADARGLFAEMQATIPDLLAILAEAPRRGGGLDRIRLRATVPGMDLSPTQASHVDLLATAWALAGGTPPPLSGVDLSSKTVLAAREVRPFAFVWDPGRSLAVRRGAVFRVPHPAPPADRMIPGESVREQVVRGLVQRRRELLSWLGT